MSDWKGKALDLAYAGMIWSTISDKVGEPNTTVYNYLRSTLGPAYLFRDSISPEDNSVILNIPDLHLCYHHPDAFDFLQAVKDKYKPTRVIQLGDELDMQAWSYHEHSPDLRSAGDELAEARECIQELYRMFPRMDLLESNHGSLTFRKAKTHGIPRALIKEYNDALQVGPGWKWHYDLTVRLPDGSPVYYHHGKASSVLRLSQQMGMSAVQGHYHESFSINYWGNPNGLMWGLQSGCLIDFKSLAFAYARVNVKRPVLGCSLIINSHPILVPMVLDNGGHWIGELP